MSYERKFAKLANSKFSIQNFTLHIYNQGQQQRNRAQLGERIRVLSEGEPLYAGIAPSTARREHS